MRFQKCLILISLVVAALSFVYSLAFNSGTLYQYGTMYLKQSDVELVAGAGDLFWEAQYLTDTFNVLSIVFILVVVLNYVMATQSRRNYYITNYISIGLTIVYQLVFAVLLIVFVTNVYGWFDAIDIDEARAYIEEESGNTFRYSTLNFTLGYTLAAAIICNAVVLGLNLLWKIKLMKGEKALLEGGLVKEVA